MKVNGFLSELLIEDLAKVSGIAFTHRDRLTRAEADKAFAWARAQPEIAKIIGDKSHPHHRSAELYRSMLEHYAAEHPQDTSGEPEAWPERGQRPEATADNPLGFLFPDEAQALHAWAQTSREYLDPYHDATHAQHRNVVARTQALLEIATRAEGAEASAADNGAGGAKMDTARQARLDELRADPAYLDAKHPGHQAAVDAVRAVYEAAAQPAARSGAAPPASATPKLAAGTPQERIATLQKDPAYWNKSDPGHAAAVQEAERAFAEAYPAPVERQ